MVPMPREPLVVKVEVPVAPKAAEPDERFPDVKRFVPVALVKVMFAKMLEPVKVLVLVKVLVV